MVMNYFKKLTLSRLQKKVFALAKQRQTGDMNEAATQKEAALHLQIAKFYDKQRYNKTFPNAEILALESFRAAAGLHNPDARYAVGQRLLERGKFWDAMQKSIYACNAHKKYAGDAYQEAFVYLQAAEEQGHALAKRLHGLAYINAWGVEKDQDKGFQMVVDSIEQEGAWDRATQIFQEIGLNKPEFFSAMMSMRKQR